MYCDLTGALSALSDQAEAAKRMTDIQARPSDEVLQKAWSSAVREDDKLEPHSWVEGFCAGLHAKLKTGMEDKPSASAEATADTRLSDEELGAVAFNVVNDKLSWTGISLELTPALLREIGAAIRAALEGE